MPIKPKSWVVKCWEFESAVGRESRESDGYRTRCLTWMGIGLILNWTPLTWMDSLLSWCWSPWSLQYIADPGPRVPCILPTTTLVHNYVAEPDRLDPLWRGLNTPVRCQNSKYHVITIWYKGQNIYIERLEWQISRNNVLMKCQNILLRGQNEKNYIITLFLSWELFFLVKMVFFLLVTI